MTIEQDGPVKGEPGVSHVTAAPSGGHPAFDRDRFLLHQKHLAINEKYHVYDESGEAVLFIERKSHLGRRLLAVLAAVATLMLIGGGSVGLAASIGHNTVSPIVLLVGVVLGIVATIVVGVALSPKRHIEFYQDETRGEELMKVFQDQKLHLISGTYTIADADLNMLGIAKKNYLDNLLRKRWFLYGPDGEDLAVVKEDSWFKSIFRRVGPFGNMMRTNFIILSSGGKTKLGEFNRKFTLLDKYVLDMTPDVDRVLDRRLAVAIAVLLDTGERR